MKRFDAFTIIELLIVIAIIAALIAILVPVLNISRSQAKQVICSNNVRQLTLANSGYANDNTNHFVPAATDIYTDNEHRWFGTRQNTYSPFDNKKGPLSSYLGGVIIECPLKSIFAIQQPSEAKFSDYEEGCGGFGYNMIYLGSKVWIDGYEDKSCKQTAQTSDVRQPAKTLMFADTAMAKIQNGGLICTQYSFAEPRFYLINGVPDTNSWAPSPSIHFRHNGRTTIGWVDAHMSCEKSGSYHGDNRDGAKPSKLKIGWFEPMDNTLFDLQ